MKVNGVFIIDEKIKRVAAYCRVSTDKTDQANSLESQQKYFEQFIKNNSNWELYNIYVDDGISGTNTKKRVAFNKMIEDAKIHKFDLIVTKEISRFARNILDSIGYTRELKELGIGVVFLNDNINTLENDAEMRLAFLSTMAQEESRKTSERVKWGLRRKMENGVVLGRDLLGYDVRDGKLIINEDGAKTVRLIFHKFLDEGKGTHKIAKELREEGIKTSNRMKDWSYTVILRILKNEKYCGDLTQQKTYTPDYLTHQKKRNYGQIETITIKNHHEPIISRERFNAVQLELERRRPKNNTPKSFANRYALSGKIICGECGSAFIRRQKKRKDGSYNVKWVCSEGQKNGKKRVDNEKMNVGCTSKSVNDEDIKLLLQKVIANVTKDKKDIIKVLLDTICSVVKNSSDNNNVNHYKKEIEKCENKKSKLLDMYLNDCIKLNEYKEKSCEIESQILLLTQKLNEEKENKNAEENTYDVLYEINSFVSSIVNGKTFNDAFYRNMVNKIIVNDKREIDVYINLLPEIYHGKILAGKQEIDDYKSNMEH